MANSIYVTGSITWYMEAHYTFYEAEEFVISVHCCTVQIYYHVFPDEPISILGEKHVTPKRSAVKKAKFRYIG